jgi:hypothetical protein
MPGGGASYEMFGFLAFDAAAGQYVQLAVDSMGTIGRSEGAFTSADQLVFTDASPYLGAPSAARLVLPFGGDGDVEMTVTSERLHGAAPALRDFEGHYRRAK